MEPIKNSLLELGLPPKEVAAYMALARLGQANANEVAKQSGLKRPTCYLVLEELVHKGLALKSPGAKSRMYIAKSPQEFIKTAKLNVQKAEAALPSFVHLFKNTPGNFKTLYFEGEEDIRRALWHELELLKDSEIKIFFGSAKYASKESLQTYHDWNKALYENGIRVKAVAPAAEDLEPFRKNEEMYGFQTKIVPFDLYSSQCAVEITKRFVRILMIKESTSIIIQNAELVKALGDIFDLVWESRK